MHLPQCGGLSGDCALPLSGDPGVGRSLQTSRRGQANSLTHAATSTRIYE